MSDTAKNTSDIAAIDVGGLNSDIAANLLLIQSNDSDIALLMSDTAKNTSDIASLGTGGLTETVLVIDNASTPTNIVNTAQQGVYLLIVKSTSDDGAGAIFTATSATNANVGVVARIVNAASSTDEEINISWLSNSKVALYHAITKTGGTGANISYDVKIVSA